MSKQTINVGVSPGDQGDGDSLREAFIKTQANFDELYSFFPVTDTSIEHDDPTIDGSIAKALLDAGASGGGTVLMASGIFRCPSAALVIPENVVLKGVGRKTSIIEVVGGHIGISMPNDFSGLESLGLRMPKAFLAKDGIKVTAKSSAHLRDLHISGGGPFSWAINLDIVNVARLENIVIGVLGGTIKPDTLTGNGIIFQNTDSTNWPFNFGDSKLTSIDIFLSSASTVGIKLHGPDNTDDSINNVLLSKVEILATPPGNGDGCVGVHLRNARRITLLGVDLESMDTAIIEEHVGSGGNFSVQNNYIATFALGVNTSYISSGVVRDRTFIGCDNITPGSAGDADVVVPRALWLADGSSRIKETQGIQFDDGVDGNGIQMDVTSINPVIRTASRDNMAQLTLGSNGTQGVECLPGLTLPQQTQPISNPAEGMLAYFSAGVIASDEGLYQYRNGAWVFIG
ncbi:MAG TPA: hypothetical protein ENJ28_08215 [Gammaproteobacteria bacterium]|nr:hypothetical protein [Gammaproteobacteria bacterium]